MRVLEHRLHGAAQAAFLAPLFGAGVDPLIRLGDDLRRGADTEVLTYTTTAKEDVYLRLAVLEDFTGTVWSPNPADDVPLGTPGGAPAAAGVTDSAVRGAVETTIVPTSDGSVGERLPITYPATNVSGVPGRAFRWEQRGLTLARLDTGDAVSSYPVESEALDTSADRLRSAATSRPAGDVQSLTLPAPVPAIIRRTANAWTAAAASPYAKALAIQNRLRDGRFSYDEQTPAKQGYDGDGLAVIARFLSVKAGYCVHFASTMAVMARLEGVPSRIVVGYQPGTSTTVDGKKRFEVTSDDLHSWPELYFDGVGWVRFEPTPGRGAVPKYAPVPSVSSGPASNEPKPSARASSAVPSTAPTTAAAGGGNTGTPLWGVLRGVGFVALVALLLALPALARRAIRRRRLRGLGHPGGAADAWLEVLATGADLGVGPRDERSPRDTEAALAAAIGTGPAARSALRRLRSGIERQAYGPAAQTANEADVGLVLQALAAGATRWRRFVAAAAPRSLLARLPWSQLAFRWSPPGSD